jgi:predicted esterase
LDKGAEIMADQITNGPHADGRVLAAGAPIEAARAAVVLVHGRGATAESILGLADDLAAPGTIYLAPQAAGNTWYPHSFLAPLAQNEPHLSSALGVLGGLLERLAAAGIPAERTVLAGFSQGACLSSEFVARNARRYGGLIVFSGGLIGPDGTPRGYAGSLAGTPVFLGCSDIDSHVPKERVLESEAVLRALGGAVTARLYPGMGHTVNQDELAQARAIVGGLI